MASGPKRAPTRKVAPVSKGAPTMAASAFSRSCTFGRRMNVRTSEKRGVANESAGSYRVKRFSSLRLVSPGGLFPGGLFPGGLFPGGRLFVDHRRGVPLGGTERAAQSVGDHDDAEAYEARDDL